MNSSFKTPEWRENRILWRANQHRLFEKRCHHFLDLSEAEQSHILGAASWTGKPILAFVSHLERWTIVTTEEVGTCHHGEVAVIRLDKVPREIRYGIEDEAATATKANADYLILGDTGIRLWVPNRFELHALWGILRMFSLRDSSA